MGLVLLPGMRFGQDELLFCQDGYCFARMGYCLARMDDCFAKTMERLKCPASACRGGVVCHS